MIRPGSTPCDASGARSAAAPAPGRGRRGRRLDPKLDTHDQLQPVLGHPEPGGRLRLGRLRALSRAISSGCSAATMRRRRCKTAVFKVPEPGFDPRGIDIDSNGVVWTALAASSHLASFDVRKCKDLNGPAKTDGSQCREGWTLYQTTGPKLKGTEHSGRLPLLQLGGSAQHIGARGQHAVRHRVELRFAAGAEPGRQRVDHAARAVSAGLLLARHGRPHRRSERRMERPRRCGRITARTSSGTSKAARAPKASSCTSSSGRIRWRDSAQKNSSRSR